jgi:hypothetical protein
MVRKEFYYFWRTVGEIENQSGKLGKWSGICLVEFGVYICGVGWKKVTG